MRAAASGSRRLGGLEQGGPAPVLRHQPRLPPGRPRRVFKWCLERVEGPNGNFMTIEYLKESGAIYPARIHYTGHRSLPSAYTVLFHLEGRPDAGAMFQNGFAVTTSRRLKAIEAHAGETLVHAYAREYSESPSTGR